MVKAFGAFFSFFLIASSCFAGAQPADCEPGTPFEKNISELETVTEKAGECPKPTKEQFLGACHTIYVKQMAAEPKPGVSYGYQESLWDMSCAKPGVDTIETAKVKIQKMWNENRENFRCYDYPNLTSSEKNIAKFSLDTGFTAFVTEAVKRYDLDMNFIDPADKKTVLDFISDQETYIRNRPPVDTQRADEYKRFYILLKSKGAKHAKEL